jgi:hypothetical protein
MKSFLSALLLLSCYFAMSQQEEDAIRDSIYIEEVQNNTKGPDKVLHAEPLYIDLIRDLGARRGEKEWNVGMGMTNNVRFDSYDALVEYEWAPVNRLGMEVELPFTFSSPIFTSQGDSLPANRLNSLKLAAQWSFYVNEKSATTMALGYINELELQDFRNPGGLALKGNCYNPFLIIARRWGNNLHTLIYTGSRLSREFEGKHRAVKTDLNTNLHYMIPGTRNFIGLEVNKTLENGRMSTTLRPQMRVGITDGVLIGIVAGIPFNKPTERLSSFVRLIWEPGHKTH